MIKIICSILICLFTVQGYAQQASDTTKKDIIDTLKKDLFTAPDTVRHLRSTTAALIPPAALMAYGASSFFIKPVRRFDKYVHTETVKHNIILKSHIEDYFQFAPPVLVYGLNLVGVHGKNTFLDRTLIYVMSEGILGASLYTLKHATHRLRPDESDRQSFPSGHTGNAFVGAEFMAQELGGNSPYYSVVGYAFATTTGVFRIYHQDHWLSDVIAGAGLGILSTKAAYLLYPLIRNRIFRAGREKEEDKTVPAGIKKKSPKNALLLPSYTQGALGMTFSMQL